ncbi:MAG: histidine kinase dimerization/phospho-acceptor domain-containing protein, partial [Candidatus Saccharimonas sp.]
LVAVGVFLRSAKGSGRWTFMALVGSTSLWAWMVALFIVANSASHAQLYANIYYTAALFIASGLAVFGQYINGQPSKLASLGWYAPALGLIALFMIDPGWLVSVANISPNLSSRVTINSWHYVLYSAVFLLIFIRGWLSLSLKKSSSRRHRRRREVVSLGLAVSGLIGLIFNLFLPWIGNYDLIAIGPIFSLLFTFSVTYAISKYSLFDLRQTFVVSLAYLLASSTAAFFYLGAVWAVGGLIVSGTNDKFVIGSLYAILALVVAMTIHPLKGYFDTLTDKLFLHERHKPEEALDSFGDAIIDDVDISSIAEKVISSMEQVVHPEFAAVVLTDKDKPDVVYRAYSSVPKKIEVLERLITDYLVATEVQQVIVTDSLPKGNNARQHLVSNGIAVVARMQLKDQRIGYIVLGEKRNGDTYMTAETLMLSTMADESALAVMNSLRFDEIQKFNARLKHDVAAATKELRASNKKLIEMDATKDEFVSMASHQLRTPLTSVKGYISMVLEGDVGEISKEQRLLLSEAFTSSERMVHLIGDFLNVSRLQTGKFIID